MYLSGRGVDVLDLFGREGFAPNIFQASDRWYPRADLLRLTNALADVTGDPCAGANIGAAAQLSDFGEFGRRVGHGETVGMACQAAFDSLGLLHRGSLASAQPEGNGVLLRFGLCGVVQHDPRHVVHASLAVLRNIVLLGGAADEVAIWLTDAPARRWAGLEAALGPRLEFGRPADGVFVPGSVLESPLALQPPASRDRDALRTTVKAAQVIAATLPEESVRIDTVARRLGLTRRTLQRRLRDCGVVFSDLVDVTRRDAALSQLSAGARNLTDLSLDLGYSDPAHFTRSFRRWTGETPSAFTRRSAAQS